MRKINIHPLTRPADLTPSDGKTVYAVIKRSCISDKPPQERFGQWEKVYNSEVSYVTRSKPYISSPNFEAFVVPKEVYEAEDIYLICVTYSNGDTFGRSSGNLDVYKILSDKTEAIKIAQQIKDYGKDFEHSKDEFPQWCGYFCRIENVEVFETQYE